MKLTVERAAIRHHDGVVFDLPRPKRHHDVISLMVHLGYPRPITGAQGFVLSDGRFCDRETALRVAKQSGQLDGKVTHSERQLFSEDLW
jgi:hypothetical protein